MGKQTLKQKIKHFISSLGWKMFLYGSELTQEQYWDRIYWEEKAHRGNPVASGSKE